MDAPLCSLCWALNDETKQASFVINGHSVCVTHSDVAKHSCDFDRVYSRARDLAFRERVALKNLERDLGEGS